MHVGLVDLVSVGMHVAGVLTNLSLNIRKQGYRSDKSKIRLACLSR